MQPAAHGQRHRSCNSSSHWACAWRGRSSNLRCASAATRATSGRRNGSRRFAADVEEAENILACGVLQRLLSAAQLQQRFCFLCGSICLCVCVRVWVAACRGHVFLPWVLLSRFMHVTSSSFSFFVFLRIRRHVSWNPQLGPASLLLPPSFKIFATFCASLRSSINTVILASPRLRAWLLTGHFGWDFIANFFLEFHFALYRSHAARLQQWWFCCAGCGLELQGDVSSWPPYVPTGKCRRYLDTLHREFHLDFSPLAPLRFIGVGFSYRVGACTQSPLAAVVLLWGAGLDLGRPVPSSWIAPLPLEAPDLRRGVMLHRVSLAAAPAQRLSAATFTGVLLSFPR